MCGLFGFLSTTNDCDNYGELINNLAYYSSERGTDATGVSYNLRHRLVTYKRPLSAEQMTFTHAEGVRAIMGHTRHATHGKCSDNYNNHPFNGIAKKHFALAHNGVLQNDSTLRKTEQLPQSKILTDSYVLVQLIEKTKELTPENLARCVELLEGSYSFTLLDEDDTLYIVKGDSPLHVLKLTNLDLIVYASTEEILYKAIIESGYSHYISTHAFEKIPVKTGEILMINKSGKITRHTFKKKETAWGLKWYDFTPATLYNCDPDNEYMTDLKQYAKSVGFLPEDIDGLIADGWTYDDIEEYLAEWEVWNNCYYS